MAILYKRSQFFLVLNLPQCDDNILREVVAFIELCGHSLCVSKFRP